MLSPLFLLAVAIVLFTAALILIFQAPARRKGGFGLLALAATLTFMALPPRDVEAASTGNTRLLYDYAFAVTPVTCPDNPGVAAAACNLGYKPGTVAYTCSDADGGCTTTLTETSPAEIKGMTMRVMNVGTATVNIADTSGVSELASAWAGGQWDTLSVVYIGDRWVETARANP